MTTEKEQKGKRVSKEPQYKDKTYEEWLALQVKGKCCLCGKDLKMYGQNSFKPHGKKRWVRVCNDKKHINFFNFRQEGVHDHAIDR